ncbi:dolichol-phosphate mannosyltransferase subunit 3 [Aspergillus piperis CBS 112811]|uniref:Dolichol-phosphate mannosyltransferase subunit 3 n=1 Tax=Aspergillus piperis CBS 112811 TaxID=1448313 RepID=A0A8G1VH25_9EURO|nr:dolichol-phosphate mannosyltransferase subunit 3 [Aspergillus piperis CBS 112811]RAH52894.1 dolichol-phosphate mannosyltransferase subunit 3 [Aspergillus piperis CBS 112811]
MTRAQQTLSVLLLVSSLYLVLYLGLVPLNETVQTEVIPVVRCPHRLPLRPTTHITPSFIYNISDPQFHTPNLLTITLYLLQLPFYALICFGCYLLGRLGLAILTFNDVPEAHEELQKEIEQAKAELRRANVDVD